MKFWKKEKNDIKADMQSENLYLVEEIKDMDWKAIKAFDSFIASFLEVGSKNSAFKPIIDDMVVNGFDVNDMKKTLQARKMLRSRIVGNKDVDRLKDEFKLNVEEIKGLKIEIQYYKDIYKASKKRPYSEEEFKQKTDRLSNLENWILDKKWISSYKLT